VKVTLRSKAGGASVRHREALDELTGTHRGRRSGSWGRTEVLYRRPEMLVLTLLFTLLCDVPGRCAGVWVIRLIWAVASGAVVATWV
jgi:hypothetical protein